MPIGTPRIGTQATSSTTSLVVPYPTSPAPAAGEFLMIWIHCNSNLVPSAAGWTAVGSGTTSTNNQTWVLYKFAAGGETGSVTVTKSNSNATRASMVGVTGVDPTTPIDQTPTVRSTGSTAAPYQMAQQAASVAGCLPVWANTVNNSGSTTVTATIPTTGVTTLRTGTVSKSGGLFHDSANLGASGNTGPRGATFSAAHANSGVFLLLRPAGAATVHQAAGTVAVVAGATGNATRVPIVHQAAGTVVVSADASGAATVAPKPVAGTVPVVVGASGAVTKIGPAAGAAPVVVGVQGAVSAILQVSGTVPVTAGATGGATRVPVVHQVSGTVPVAAGASGAATKVSPVSGVVPVAAVAVGAVTSVQGVSGTVPVVSGAAGDATVVPTTVIHQVSGQVDVSVGFTGPTPPAYTAFKLQPTALRNFGAANSVQLGEFQVIAGGVRQTGAVAFDESGVGSGAEGAEMANDGLNTGSKWLSFNKLGAYIILLFPSPVTAEAVRLGSANDFPERDPVQFDLYGSNDTTAGTPGTFDLLGSYEWPGGGADPGRLTYMSDFPIEGGPTVTLIAQVSGSAPVTAGAAGAVTKTTQASGTVPVSAGASGAITKRTPVSGTVPVVAGATGNATRVPLVLQVSGTVAVTSAAAGDATRVPVQLGTSGTAPVSSAVQGSVSAILQVSGVVPVSAAASGDATRVGIVHQVSGVVPVSAAASGTVTKRTPASGTVTVVTGASGSVTKRTQVSGSVPVVAAAQGAVTSIQGVSGQVDVASGATGDAVRVGITHQVAGTVAVASAVAGTVTKIAPAAGEVQVTSDSTGTVTAILQASPFRETRRNHVHDPRGTTVPIVLAGRSTVTDFPGDVTTAYRFTRQTTAAVRMLDVVTGLDSPTTGVIYFRARVRTSDAQNVEIAYRPDVLASSGSAATRILATVAIPAGESVIEGSVDITGMNAATARAGISLIARDTTLPVGGTFDATAFQVEAAPLGGYFDGSSTDTPNNLYGWDGTADDSDSVLTSNVTEVPVTSGSTGDATRVPVVHQVSGQIPVTSGATGAATGLKPVSGTAGVLSGSTGSASRVPRILQVSGTVPVTSASEGTAQYEDGASGVVDVTSGTSGTVTKIMQVSGTVPVASAAAGSVTKRTPVSGSVPVTSGASGAITKRSPVSGTVPVVSALQGTVSAMLQVTGVVPVTSDVDGTISLRFQVSGTIMVSSGANGTIHKTYQVAGLVPVVSGASGDVSVEEPFRWPDEIVLDLTGSPLLGMDIVGPGLTIEAGRPAVLTLSTDTPAATLSVEAQHLTLTLED